MEPAERQLILDELSARPDLWGDQDGDRSEASMTDTSQLSERYSRQKDIVPPDRLAACRATVIGVGAIGRQVALQLAAMGVPWLQLIDFDVVEPSNLASQGYLEEDLGRPKVEATGELCHRINHGLELHQENERFRRSMEIGNAVFCAVDKIEIRRLIWDAVKDKASFFTDGRMSAEVLRVLTACDAASAEALPDDAVCRRGSLRRALHGQDHDLLRQYRGRADARPVHQVPTAPACGRRTFNSTCFPRSFRFQQPDVENDVFDLETLGGGSQDPPPQVHS